MTRVLAVDASPTGPGRTRTVLEAVLAAAAGAGAETTVVSLADGSPDAVERAVAACSDADAFVLGAPVYRGAPAAPMKAFLDLLPRGFWGEREQPVTARPVGLVLTGSTFHHYLALNDLRNVLAGFFAAHVLSPGLYVPGEGFDAEKALTPAYADLAADQGRAVVALAAAIDASEDLRRVRPQA